MIPLQDALPPRTRPWATWTLVGTAVLATAAALLAGADRPGDATGLTPAGFAWTDALASLFVAHGPAPLAVNVIALAILGENVEDRVGHLPFLAFYLTSGVAALAVTAWLTPLASDPIAGASGAVAAVLGAHLMLYPHGRVLVFPIVVMDAVEVPSGALVALWFLIQVLGGFPDLPVSGANAAAAFWVPTAGLVVGGAAIWLIGRGPVWD